MNWLQNELYKINENIIQKSENNNFVFKKKMALNVLFDIYGMDACYYNHKSEIYHTLYNKAFNMQTHYPHLYLN